MVGTPVYISGEVKLIRYSPNRKPSERRMMVTLAVPIIQKKQHLNMRVPVDFVGRNASMARNSLKKGDKVTITGTMYTWLSRDEAYTLIRGEGVWKHEAR